MNKPISYGHEVFRKLIHLSSLWMVASIGYFPKWFNISLFAALLFIMLVVEYGNNKRWPLFTMTYGALFNRILRECETRETFRPSGAPYLIAAVLFATILFPRTIAMTALSIMLVGDTFAALIGRKLGRHKINHGKKSIEGSIAFWLFSFIVLLLFYHYSRQPLSFLLYGALGITLATFAEIYENRIHIDDNFSIPLIVGLCLMLTHYL
ncbi:SEC59/DGK1/VTE5 family protein [Oxalobacter sp. OxGP1]|uniref:diacylglycerol/polyprenol kinase family protein n=1 Tax=Oxalobacter paeniformigenes TaxID=2946594 RepID=UPI0022AE9D6B|nr:diacylglycerol/polyprenol kinase family protein [Oxalobacter paeniformigenes]MCZ4053447.1 SEC59/DGK1/VTE5 family protein [Oxalobacter paeniformigenes]